MTDGTKSMGAAVHGVVEESRISSLWGRDSLPLFHFCALTSVLVLIVFKQTTTSYYVYISFSSNTLYHDISQNHTFTFITYTAMYLPPLVRCGHL